MQEIDPCILKEKSEEIAGTIRQITAEVVEKASELGIKFVGHLFYVGPRTVKISLRDVEGNMEKSVNALKQCFPYSWVSHSDYTFIKNDQFYYEERIHVYFVKQKMSKKKNSSTQDEFVVA